MKTIAVVAWEAKRPLEGEEIDCEGPKAGEGLVRMKATGVCHTDAFTLSGEDNSYELGTGAGFYVDATRSPWAKNYRMYSYGTREFRELVEREPPVDGARAGIFGHSYFFISTFIEEPIAFHAEILRS